MAVLVPVLVSALARPPHLDAIGAGAAIETMILVCLLPSAVLLFLHFNRTRSLRDLGLLSAVVAVSLTDVAFSALPALGGSTATESGGGARLACELLVALAFCAAAVAPKRATATPRRLMAGVGLLAIGAVAGAGVVEHLTGSHWASMTLQQTGITAASSYPVALAVHVTAAFVLLLAAIAFRIRTEPGEGEGGLLAGATVLLAGVMLLYLTTPPVAADWLTPGDGLRFSASALLLAVAIANYAKSRRAIAREFLSLERQRLARDLHDGLAQDLAFIVSHGQQMESQLGPDHPVTVAARRALAASRGAIADLSASTAPTTAVALHQVADELEARFGVSVPVRVAAGLEAEDQRLFDPDEREHVVRIAREAIVNAARHGGAGRIDVSLERRLDQVRLCVSDNGRGVSGESPNPPLGFGRAAMRARAAALGGRLTTQALPGGGTEVELILPPAARRNRYGDRRTWRLRGRLATIVLAAVTGLASVASVSSEARQRAPHRSPGHHRHRIWVPAPRTTWQWQLTTPVDTSVPAKVYDIDLFDNPALVVAGLHRQGRKVVCYLDAGTYENYRPDAHQFPGSVLGNPNGWPGERWLDIRRLSVLGPIMRARFQMCKHKGFDAVEADNVDGYQNGSGFPLTASDQLTYNKWLAHTAHSLGLAIALKNDLGQVGQLQPYFDFALNEQCFEFSECSQLHPFVAAHKAVFEVEYNLAPSQFCSRANGNGFMAMRKNLNLDATRQACW